VRFKPVCKGDDKSTGSGTKEVPHTMAFCHIDLSYYMLILFFLFFGVALVTSTSDVNKTKFLTLRPRPPEVNKKGTWRI